MGRKAIRLVALILCLISILTILPFGALADEDPAYNYNGGQDGYAGGATGGWREWNRNRAGYRIYVVDKDGNMASNAIDYLFSAPSGIGQWIWSTKVEGLQLNKSPNTVKRLDVLINIAHGFTGDYTTMPKPITMPNNKCVPHGEDLKNWLTNGKEWAQSDGSHYSWTTTTTNKYAGENSSKNSGGTPNLSNVDPSKVKNSILNALRWYVDTYAYGGSGSTSERLKTTGNKLNDWINGTSLKTLLKNNGITDYSSINEYKVYANSEKSKLLMQARDTLIYEEKQKNNYKEDKMKDRLWGKESGVPDRIESVNYTKIDAGIDGSLMISFAGPDSSDSSNSNDFKNLVALINLRDASGKYILQINRNESKGIAWYNENNLETTDASEYKPTSTMIHNYGLKLMIEPISWIAAHDPSSGVTYTRVYGTYSNINAYYSQVKGLYMVSGYENIFNAVGPTCLKLTKDVKFTSKTISKVGSGSFSSKEAGRSDMGYSLHVITPPFKDDPDQKTYDPPKETPEGHPAPDPTKIQLKGDPEVARKERKYTIIKTYVELVNDNLTDAQIEAKGGETYLRTVYDGHPDGWYERHIGTYERLENPPRIRILHEDIYEVKEFITSNTVRHPESKDTTWADLVVDDGEEDGMIWGHHVIVDDEETHEANKQVEFIDMRKMPEPYTDPVEYVENEVLYVKLQKKLWDDTPPEEPGETPPITIDAVLHESQLTKAVGSDANYEGAVGGWSYKFDGLLPSVTSSHTYTASGSHKDTCPDDCSSDHSYTATCTNLLRANGDNKIQVDYYALWGHTGNTMYESANYIDSIAGGLSEFDAQGSVFATGDKMNITLVTNRGTAAVDQRGIKMPKTVDNKAYHHPTAQPYVYMTLTRRGDGGAGRIDNQIVGAGYKTNTLKAGVKEQLSKTVVGWSNTSAGHERSTWKDGTRSVDTGFSFAIQLNIIDGDTLAKCPTHSGNSIASVLDVWVLDNGTKTQETSEVVTGTQYTCPICGYKISKDEIEFYHPTTGKPYLSTHFHTNSAGGNVVYPFDEEEIKETRTTGARIYREGNLKVEGYAGEVKTKASKDVTNLKGYNLSVMTGDGAKYTKHTSHVAKKVTNTLEFYPYIRMSFMLSMDADAALTSTGNWYTEDRIKELKDNGVTNKNAKYLQDRTVYVLSDKKSQVQPTNAVEISWYNDTQANNSNGIGGINITSQQWSVHKRATDGSAVWKKQNSVLPGGAIYQLDSQGQESWIQTNTYFTVVKDAYTANSGGMTVDDCVTANQNYITELKDILENYNLVQWVGKDFNESTAWSGVNSVKIAGKGTNLNKLGMSTKSSTEDKHVLFRGTVNNANGASEADLDITQQAYQTQVFKCFTNTEGRVYVAILTQKSFSKNQMDKAQLDKLIAELSTIDGASMRTKISDTLKDDYNLRVVQIGEIRGSETEPVDSLEKIINRLKDGKLYTMLTGTQDEVTDAMASYLYQVEMKTGFISNTVNAVTRGKGDDYTAAWVAGKAWYNEAYDGFYVVKQSAVYKVGLSSPSKRVSVLDPNLCPPKSSGTSSVLTNAFISQFRIDSQSNSSYTTAKAPTQTGYMGTFAGMDVYLEDIENLMTSRPFYIPNANVQDLS